MPTLPAALWLCYFACLLFAGQPGPAAYFFAVTGPAVGFLALAATASHVTRKGRAPHA